MWHLSLLPTTDRAHWVVSNIGLSEFEPCVIIATLGGGFAIVVFLTAIFCLLLVVVTIAVLILR